MSQRAPIAPNFTVEDRRSACPGLFRMAKALDGAICRVKLTFGEFSAEQARQVAEAAEKFGNGIIEITNRANLQIRGVRAETEALLIAALLDAGLGPLTDRGDDVRNVMVSPVAGVDHALVDVRPLALRLLTALQLNAGYQTLSPKFSVLVDGGETVAMVEHPHDIWVSPIDPESKTSQFAFGIAGVPPTGRDDRPALGRVNGDEVFAVVTSIIDLFLEWSRGNPAASRMRHFLADIGEADFLQQLERGLGHSVGHDASAPWLRRQPRAHGHLGVLIESASTFLIGAMPPLGRLDPDVLVALAALAQEQGNGHLRLTPWQSILLPGIATAGAQSVLARLEALGLHSDPETPLATMISCSGSAGCGSALAATQADGFKLATLLGPTSASPQIHVSGCMKSCASPGARPITLVATAPGHYDIFLQATNGPSRFGKLLAANVTIEEAADLIGKNFGAS